MTLTRVDKTDHYLLQAKLYLAEIDFAGTACYLKLELAVLSF